MKAGGAERMPIVQQASARGVVQLHAWIYDLRTEYLRELARDGGVPGMR
jgi:carbonic anhydrase